MPQFWDQTGNEYMNQLFTHFVIAEMPSPKNFLISGFFFYWKKSEKSKKKKHVIFHSIPVLVIHFWMKKKNTCNFPFKTSFREKKARALVGASILRPNWEWIYESTFTPKPSVIGIGGKKILDKWIFLSKEKSDLNQLLMKKKFPG